jgi:hypothetical protein
LANPSILRRRFPTTTNTAESENTDGPGSHGLTVLGDTT